MLRNPYGKKSDPIDRFTFEEFTPQYGLKGMLWGNGSMLAGILLAQTFTKQSLKKMNLGSILSLGDMPYYFYTDKDGDQVALPCTERLLNVRTAGEVSTAGFIPVLSVLNRNEVKLGGFHSIPARPSAAHGRPRSSRSCRRWPRSRAGARCESEAGESSETETSAEESSGGGDTDLDALLASLGSDNAPADSASADSGETGEASAAEGGDDSAMDPELAALLAELG